MNTTVVRSAHSRRTKIYAVLAGGLVLGVGTAVTLAAWNDSEFASVDFAAGSFVFQGSTDGTTFADHASEAGAAELTFTAPFDNLSPDDVVYAPFALRLEASTPADLTSIAPVVTGTLSGDLAFAAVETTAFGCDATSFAAGTAVPTTITGGETVNLCLQVTAGPDIEQGGTGTAVWQWNAVSQ
ncbi:SipW-dependent-type signal peptide-containing protein [Microbacterium sp. M28]|uniref:SipW-dependent-type signal peptide-containing protein n=1 Tax=Microbacterium sp. M28 TaxID=2962064 RepID=UPI0021F4D89E|nr:SipW-dependent-type signal peptide-containing protein [Microbacterium sp. M28]UYO95850.1 SipW-dependent-type signal peptide-containing protein [Microbacterium sp. M28]